MNPKKEPIGIEVLRGVGIHILGQVVVVATAFFITPRLVHGMGTGVYAIFTLIWTLLNCFSLFGLGTNTGTVRYTSLWIGKKQPARLGALLSMSFLFQLSAACAAGAINYLLSNWLAGNLLDLDAGLTATASSVFAWVSAAIPFFFVLRFATDILTGQKRFAIYNVIFSLQTVAVTLTAAVLLALGKGIHEIAISFTVVFALLAGFSLWLVRRAIWTGRNSGERGDNRAYFAFSFKAFLSQALWIVTFQGDRFIIGALLPIKQLGFYVIASAITQKLNVLCHAVTSTAYPILTELHGQGDEVRLRRIYLKSTQLNLYLILPITILTVVLAPQFLTLWLGEEFSRMGTWPLRLLALANFAYIGSMLPYVIALGKGYPQWQIAMQVGKVTILLLVWAVGIPRWGISGAAAGLMVSECVGTPIYAWWVHRRLLNLGLWEFWSGGCWRPCAAGLTLAVASLATHEFVGSWFSLAAFGAGVGAAYLATGYVLLDPDAKSLLKDWLRRRLPFKIP